MLSSRVCKECRKTPIYYFAFRINIRYICRLHKRLVPVYIGLFIILQLEII